MDKGIKLKCSCGNTLTPDLSEEFNHKDVLSCDCGKRYLIVDITNE